MSFDSQDSALYKRNRVLIVSNDVIGEEMAGPGIRYWELARVLAHHAEVTLAAPNLPSASHPSARLVSYADAPLPTLSQLLREHDILFTDPFGIDRLFSEIPPHLFCVVDLYDPFPLENLELFRHRPSSERYNIYHNDLHILERALHRGDFFVCSSERQRDFWIGALLLAGRISPTNYDSDPTLERLLAVVPFGLPPDPPQATGPFLRGVHPAVGPEDKVILWGGGIWNWLDPITLLHALARVVRKYSRVKLVFPGTRHPNPIVPEMAAYRAATELASHLGLLDTFVFFGEWVPYHQRANYLLEADIGITLHRNHVETRMAFRTRVLDYIWAGLPIIASDGDSTADVVRQWNIGLVVRPEDVDNVTEALEKLIQLPDPKAKYAPALRRAAAQFTWERVAAPLVAYCRQPYRSADARWRTEAGWASRTDLKAQLESVRQEAAHWRQMVQAYERGRFIRTMKRLHRWRQQVWSRWRLPFQGRKPDILSRVSRVKGNR